MWSLIVGLLTPLVAYITMYQNSVPALATAALGMTLGFLGRRRAKVTERNGGIATAGIVLGIAWTVLILRALIVGAVST